EQLPGAKRVVAAAELGSALRVEPPQKVACAVRVELRHERRPVAGEAVADRRQLPARGEADVVVAEDVRPQHAAGDRADGERRLDAEASLEDGAGTGKADEEERGGGGGEGLAADP